MPDLSETMRLLEQTSARLCHDLGGLIGTVGGAVEMLTANDDGDEEIAAFATTAARALTQRLRLMRAAWGPDAEPMTLSTLRALVVPPLTARRIVLNTTALPADCWFSPAIARASLNLILLAADGLPRGGTIVVAGAPEDLFVRIDGAGAAWPEGVAACVHDEAAAIAALSSARSVQLSLTALFALCRNLRITPVIGPQAGGGSGIAALRLTAG